VPARMPRPVIGWMGGYYNLKYFATADYLIGVTPRIRDYIVERGVAPQRAFVCHTFGTMPDAPPVSRASLGVPQDALLLLTLSRLHPKKGIDTAIRALARLANAHLCVAGDGPKQAKYETLARELGLSDRVHFLGWRTDRKALLQACDICLLPSRYEPFGTVIAEAWSMRRPLIAALADGARQYVRDGENGVVFPIDDAEALARCVTQIAGAGWTWFFSFVAGGVLSASYNIWTISLYKNEYESWSALNESLAPVIHIFSYIAPIISQSYRAVAAVGDVKRAALVQNLYT